jgi:hypothetical protein
MSVCECVCTTHLTNVGRLAAHVGPGDDEDPLPTAIEARIVGHVRHRLNGLDHGMPPADHLDHRHIPRNQDGTAIVSLRCHCRQGRQAVQGRQGLRHLPQRLVLQPHVAGPPRQKSMGWPHCTRAPVCVAKYRRKAAHASVASRLRLSVCRANSLTLSATKGVWYRTTCLVLCGWPDQPTRIGRGIWGRTHACTCAQSRGAFLTSRLSTSIRYYTTQRHRRTEKEKEMHTDMHIDKRTDNPTKNITSV